MNKSLLIIGAAALVVMYNKSKAERSANVDLSASDLDLLIAKIKADTELQQKLRGPAGSGATLGKAKIELAGLGHSYGGVVEGGVFEGGGAFRIALKETAGIASKGDVFLRIEPVGAGVILNGTFDVNNRDSAPESEAPFRFVHHNNGFWTAMQATGEEFPELVFKIGGTVGKTGIGPHEYLPGIFASFNFSGPDMEVGDPVGLKFTVYGPQIEGFVHTITKPASA